MRGERGTVTIWMLGLSLLLLLFGGLALDFWRALALQRELAAVADSAAVAAASGIDEGIYRATGTLVVDPERATGLALQSMAFQELALVSADIDVAPDGSAVSISISAEVELGLLGVFVSDDAPLLVSASAQASPVLVP